LIGNHQDLEKGFFTAGGAGGSRLNYCEKKFKIPFIDDPIYQNAFQWNKKNANPFFHRVL